jgi:hypothetical protein
MIRLLSPDDPDDNRIWQQAFRQNNPTYPFFQSGWYKAFFETIGKTYPPLILFDTDNAVIAPFYLDQHRAILSGGINVTDYADIIGPENSKKPAWINFIEFLGNTPDYQIELHNIPEFSATFDFFRNDRHYPGAIIQTEETTPVVRLPKDHESYMWQLDRKTRHEFRRKFRNFTAAFPEITTIDMLPAVGMEIFTGLMSLNPEKKTFLNPDNTEFFRDIARSYTDNSFIRIISIKGNPAAAIWYFISGKTVLLYNSGFNEKKYSGSGNFIVAGHILWAIEHGFTEYNFLRGNERYKYDLGGKDEFVYSIRLNIRPSK